MNWKTLNSSYLIRRKYLTVRKDQVELPSGYQINDYFVLEYPDWVSVIGLTKDEQFIMVRQYRHGLQKTSYELCAGVHDAADEDYLATAKREMLEETGYGNGEWEAWLTCSPNPGTHTNMSITFLATNLELVQEQQLEAGEDITVHLFNKAEIKELLMKNEIAQAMHAAPLWKYLAGVVDRRPKTKD